MTQEEILTELDKVGLGHYREQAKAVLQPALTLQTVPTPDEDLPTGASKMGGLPDLSASTAWPCTKGIDAIRGPRPLHFLAQINFTDTASVWPDSPLPGSGLLSVFYDAEDTPDTGRDGFEILYTPNTDVLERRALPDSLQTLLKRTRIPGQFHSCAVQFTKTVPLRPLIQLDTTHEEFDTLFELASADRQEFGAHQMLGRADYEQDSPLPLLAMTTLGVRFTEGMEAAEGTALRAQIDAEAQHWFLLIQIDTDDNPGWGWGDGGMLYFHIHESDLAARRFDKALMDAQCG